MTFAIKLKKKVDGHLPLQEQWFRTMRVKCIWWWFALLSGKIDSKAFMPTWSKVLGFYGQIPRNNLL